MLLHSPVFSTSTMYCQQNAEKKCTMSGTGDEKSIELKKHRPSTCEDIDETKINILNIHISVVRMKNTLSFWSLISWGNGENKDGQDGHRIPYTVQKPYSSMESA